MDPDRQADLAALDSTLTTVERVLDVDGLRIRIEKLEHEASDPNLWDDQSRAQKVTSELSHTQGELRRVEELRQRLDDLPVIYEMAAEEGGERRRRVAEADAELQEAARGHRGDGGPHAARRASTTSARRWSTSAPAPAGWTPPTGPRC